MSSPSPLLVSQFRRQLDAHHRLRLPAPWRIWNVESWLLYPPELLGEDRADWRKLHLVPVTEPTPASISEALKMTAAQPPPLAAALAALRGGAVRRGIDPDVVTLHHTNERAIHLKLTTAQLTWLGLRNRSLVLTGVMTGIDIWSSAEFARWKRALSR